MAECSYDHGFGDGSGYSYSGVSGVTSNDRVSSDDAF